MPSCCEERAEGESTPYKVALVSSGAAKKPYSLRNTNGASTSSWNEDGWKSSNDRNSWRRGDAPVKGAKQGNEGLTSSAREESQPALINMGGGGSGSNSNMATPMNLSEASLMTPFGTNGVYQAWDLCTNLFNQALGHAASHVCHLQQAM